jgi:deoxyribodipyrimidine photo-lyase
MLSFEPTQQAVRARLAAVDPAAYARTRNALDGHVTRLSPYLTHGFLSLREVYAAVRARHPLDAKHKFVFELGWRAYYRHVWSHVGERIHQSLHAGLLPDDAYLTEMPADVLQARTGIAAIDLAVSELYETGYVHNHARMWLASYLVHLRKVHWHTGAQWMLGHLLDGDVASNHLSWQWVAGTGSNKPYLFNADNVAKYAPTPWHSPDTLIDTSYEALDAVARGAAAIDTRLDARRAGAGMAQPALRATPLMGAENPASASAHGHATQVPTWQRPGAKGVDVAGRDVWLHHPWSIGAPPEHIPAGALQIGIGIEMQHAGTPWSERRWDFVTRGLKAHTEHLWWGSAEQMACALQHARSVHWHPDPHMGTALARLQAALQRANTQHVVGPCRPSCLFEPVDTYCRSFSQWWTRTRIEPSP